MKQNEKCYKKQKRITTEYEELKNKAYERYQLKWMMEHGYSLGDIKEIVTEIIGEKAEYNPLLILSNREVLLKEVENVTDSFLNERGFSGNIFSCKNEFLSNEYQDRDYMQQLLDETDFALWMVETSQFETFDIFTVDNKTVSFEEGAYYVGDTVTEDESLIARGVTYSGAEFNQFDLSNFPDENDMLISITFENSKQWIEDITEDEMKSRAEKFIDEGYIIASPKDGTLKDGKYIWIL